VLEAPETMLLVGGGADISDRTSMQVNYETDLSIAMEKHCGEWNREIGVWQVSL
jgi:hypothetical protein